MAESKEKQGGVSAKENEEKIRGWMNVYYSSANVNGKLPPVEKGQLQFDEKFLYDYFSVIGFDDYLVRLNSAILYLGGQKAFSHLPNISTEFDFIEIIKNRVPKKSIYYLMAITDFSSKHMATLFQISDGELKRNPDNELLNTDQSEKAVELARLYSRGAEVFGSLDAFKQWMDSSVTALGNKKPMGFLDTSLGVEMLMDELGRIEHGIFA